jgi:hypothetical protein
MKASIAVANHKGGVGKTVTAVNLAGRLAQRGRRTLLVDVDAQAHATLWFAERVEHDLQDVLIEGIPVRQAIVPTRIEGLALLPATLALARLELELVGLARREDRIRRALDTVEQERRQPATGPPGSYPDRTCTGWRTRACAWICTAAITSFRFVGSAHAAGHDQDLWITSLA